uniref:Uncharacterized protein n=1 Tax=Knipowitschia caucasica TaxID=637954 RepID=A0AAV2KKL8_KNICA
MAMEQGRVTEFEGKSLDQIQIEPEGRAVEILSQTDGLKETSSGEPSTIHPDAPHGSGSAPSERRVVEPHPLSSERFSSHKPLDVSPPFLSPLLKNKTTPLKSLLWLRVSPITSKDLIMKSRVDTPDRGKHVETFHLI